MPQFGARCFFAGLFEIDFGGYVLSFASPPYLRAGDVVVVCIVEDM
jgi:hypothetical protein